MTGSPPPALPLALAMAEPIRLRTLVVLRWVAISGQLAAVAVSLALGLRLPLLAVLTVIGISAVLNLVLSRWQAEPDSRLITLHLTLDVAQVALLLALTGGLSNPFAMLMLAPVTIAATALDRKAVAFMALATLLMVTLVGLVAMPVVDAAGVPLQMPRLLRMGHWFALMTGVGFFAAYAHRVARELRSRTTALAATEMALAREQRLQHLGGVVAAAAHEMGTPLATIKLVSAELRDELADRPDLAADLALLAQSADRCRDILRSMGRAGKDDVLLRTAPLSAILEDAAAPHAGRGRIRRQMLALDDSPEPVMRRDAGLVHGLRNVIQNAVDFAAGEVCIDAAWTEHTVSVTIADDGPGFPPAVLARAGQPFVGGRTGGEERPGYEGMGLGLFIAKTLLERSGASVGFRNGGPGAVVDLAWPRARIEDRGRGRAALGENPVITA